MCLSLAYDHDLVMQLSEVCDLDHVMSLFLAYDFYLSRLSVVHDINLVMFLLIVYLQEQLHIVIFFPHCLTS